MFTATRSSSIVTLPCPCFQHGDIDTGCMYCMLHAACSSTAVRRHAMPTGGTLRSLCMVHTYRRNRLPTRLPEARGHVIEGHKPRQDLMRCRASMPPFLYTTTTLAIWQYLARADTPGIQQVPGNTYVSWITLSRTRHLTARILVVENDCCDGWVGYQDVPQDVLVQQIRTCRRKPLISVRVYSAIAIISPLDDGQLFSSLRWQPRWDSKCGTWSRPCPQRSQ